jgi:hypothetical protein
MDKNEAINLIHELAVQRIEFCEFAIDSLPGTDVYRHKDMASRCAKLVKYVEENLK